MIGQANPALMKKLQEIAPTLAEIGGQLVASVMTMQGSEMPPTASQLEACKKQEAAYTSLMARWAALKEPADRNRH